jgi:hypothetical protein
MKEHPILYTDEMVRAYLDGQKTMTRRLAWQDNGKPSKWQKVQVGNVLWGREAHYIIAEGRQYFYRATGGYSNHKAFDEAEGNAPLVWRGPWKPNIFMPRKVCRILQTVTAVGVERLHDITKAEAIAEGIERDGDGWREYSKGATDCCHHPVDSYASLWESIYGYGSWDLNPEIVVLSFEPFGGAA